jgi:hypothetical protein
MIKAPKEKTFTLLFKLKEEPWEHIILRVADKKS